MIDLHTHILPAADDGSPDLATSVRMAETALRCGTRTLVATPHSNQEGRFENFASRELDRRFDRLEAALRDRGLPLQLLRGMEIFATEDMGDKIRDGLLSGLNGGRYYLVEFPFDAPAGWMEERLLDVQSCGGIPLAAHVERYDAVQENPEIIYSWVRAGTRIQLNAGSLFGRFGQRAMITSRILLDCELATCLASDAHFDDFRAPRLDQAAEELLLRYGQSAVDTLLVRNPVRILDGKEIPAHGRRPERYR